MRLNNKKIDIELARRCWDDVDLAEKLGVTTTALYYQRYGTKRTRKSTIGKIALALEVPVEDIIECSTPNNQEATAL